MGQLSIPDGATLYLDTAPIIYSSFYPHGLPFFQFMILS